MATIIRTASPIFDDDAINSAATLATNYWGDLSNELLFVLPFWQVHRMLSVAGSNQIALRITNIDNPVLVYANWIVFEESMADTLTDPVEPAIYYFVLDDSYFNGPIFTNTNPSYQLEGIRHISPTPERNVLWGRLGKVVNDDETESYYVSFLAAQCSILGPGGGGGGALSGAKIPRS